ncbi:endonuclease/exonuclease/phosphatase family protein [Mucilaginibacter sp. RS28]|uniref:Endonuclease/exonuclease/phosphatase family protein n=2 Tax=Mucilaginibacter straminoryzae TaxID=2932774 RepID=A0A9X1X0Y3_9SPHI|nr:endonuclease/exonuclease/phosphatase family protein [Mucilaginibacter straminoryzae]MCJ8209139.1 endonuclease/exonuclease/phosphatase family protein [Mucilaginibacter straminoryzae]
MYKHFLAILLVWSAISVKAQSLVVGTFNLRFDNPADSGNLWVNRAPVVASLIKFHDFDILGTQEGLKNQLDDISKALPEYNRYGVGRNDGIDGGEHSAIFYKKDKFKLLAKGDFWLSQTPDKPSLGWDATCCNRICSWVYLQDVKSSKKFYVFNAHFDHQGKVAREESSKLILAKIKTIAGDNPVILTGDFNGDHSSVPYQLIANSQVLKDTYNVSGFRYENNPSFNSFGRSLKETGIIDHIFISSQFTAEKWGVLSDSYHGKYPSDHFPVLSLVKFK